MKIVDIKILTLATILALAIIQTYFHSVHCAPNGNIQATNNNSNNKNNKNQSNTQHRPINFLRGLFRRQTSSSASSSTSTDSGRQQSSVEAEGDEAMSQTELDAQKFMESLPNVVSIWWFYHKRTCYNMISRKLDANLRKIDRITTMIKTDPTLFEKE